VMVLMPMCQSHRGGEGKRRCTTITSLMIGLLQFLIYEENRYYSFLFLWRVLLMA
jgi:hypothetical protein